VRKLAAKFIASVADVRRLPPDGPPEVAFLGRSNVGKSSLINSLLGTKIAHISSTPGRTQTLNFIGIYTVPEKPAPDLIFVDFPGYGYARVPRAILAEWPSFIEPYLKQRQALVLGVVLVDSNVPPQARDVELIAWLRAVDRPHVILATKADRLSRSKLPVVLRELAKTFHADQILSYSAKTGAGQAELWREIRSAAALRR